MQILLVQTNATIPCWFSAHCCAFGARYHGCVCSCAGHADLFTILSPCKGARAALECAQLLSYMQSCLCQTCLHCCTFLTGSRSNTGMPARCHSQQVGPDDCVCCGWAAWLRQQPLRSLRCVSHHYQKPVSLKACHNHSHDSGDAGSYHCLHDASPCIHAAHLQMNSRCKHVLPHAGADLYLCNWCSVQRVAYRCRVLSSRRLNLLNSIEFDWTGADPLS